MRKSIQEIFFGDDSSKDDKDKGNDDDNKDHDYGNDSSDDLKGRSGNDIFDNAEMTSAEAEAEDIVGRYC